ncbi:hypothetical protein A1O1_01468 [Capronia coronata CBS 617.96]|uniref:Uncharacterized protein n=1 Tax=Capronia coronata CBS 617.96 TaxID=1182541 RepID=W9YTZ4_9EURO|nr:uncharacterized protein A1O1_01468 [Capronia coronata CBS 617.96]EXJ96342.1 hypothetical protein A1O1_01468 [Capronia coronata CBS 617.96]
MQSRPYDQLEYQEIVERRRILEEHENGTHVLPVETNLDRLTSENVKKRWDEQGIWPWDGTASDGIWKHERSPEPDTDVDTDEASPAAIFSFGPSKPNPKRRQVKSDQEKQQDMERRATRERQRQASRPFFQFIYQVSQERDRIHRGDASNPMPVDINTTAYQNVRDIWVKRHIWDKRWGIMPGMTWKHEHPWEELLEEDTGRSPAEMYTFVTQSPEATPPRQVLNTPPSVGPDQPQPQVFNLMDTSLDQQAANIEDAASQPIPSVSLGPVHSSKVSKPTAKKRSGLRRPKVMTEASLGNPPPVSASNTPATPQRRSERLRKLRST